MKSHSKYFCLLEKKLIDFAQLFKTQAKYKKTTLFQRKDIRWQTSTRGKKHSRVSVMFVYHRQTAGLRGNVVFVLFLFFVFCH